MTDTLLPDYPSIARGPIRGRVPYEGYQRGVGIMYGDLPSVIEHQPDYCEAYAIALERSLVWSPRLMNLYLLLRYFLPKLQPGAIIEFGSYRGGSAMFMAKLAQKYLPETTVYALDTFAGMPETDPEADYHRAGDFADANFAEIAATKDALGLSNLELVRGLFDETTPGVLARIGPIALAHIDCDIYHPAIYAFEQVKSVMVPGGYVIFDDATEATCLGATQAVEEIIQGYGLRSEQIAPHFVFRYPPI